MTKIVFVPVPVIPRENPFSDLAFPGVPANFKFVCTVDSCFCKSVFDNIVEAYKELAENPQEVIVVNTFLFVSSRIATLVQSNPELAPKRY